jgi:hypothetical protein
MVERKAAHLADSKVCWKAVSTAGYSAAQMAANWDANLVAVRADTKAGQKAVLTAASRVLPLADSKAVR